jgi:hypothetical protein
MMKTARLCTLLGVDVLLGIFLGGVTHSATFGIAVGLALPLAIWLAAKHLEARNAQRS